jgi:hypothetical protein
VFTYSNEIISVKDYNSDLTVYPNPNHGYFFISNIQENVHVELYSLSGQLISSQTTSEKYIHFSDIEAGLYLLKIEGENTMYYKKIVVK